MKGLIFLIISFISAMANAGQTTSTIEYVHVSPENDQFVIKLDNPIQTRPNCATDDRLIYGLTNSSGQAALSMAMAIKASGGYIHISGNGDCTGDKENIGWMRQL